MRVAVVFVVMLVGGSGVRRVHRTDYMRSAVCLNRYAVNSGVVRYVVRVTRGHLRTADRLDAPFAISVAETMQALATASRVRILGRLRSGPLSVNELAVAVEMDPSAVSQQLRVLRHLGFVVGQRDGRRVLYDLHDDHVAHLLDEAISHVEHVQLGLAGRARQASSRAAEPVS